MNPLFRSIPSLFLILSLATGCATSSKPWVEGGKKRGEVKVITTSNGYERQYFELGGRLARVEVLDANKQLVPGSCQLNFFYHEKRELSSQWNMDADGKPINNDAGWAARTVSRPTAIGNGFEVREGFFDASSNPTTTMAGFHQRVFLSDKQDMSQVREIRFLDIEGKPAPSRIDGAPNTVAIELCRTDAGTIAVVGLYRDSSGRIVHRKRVAGGNSSWGVGMYEAPMPLRLAEATRLESMTGTAFKGIFFGNRGLPGGPPAEGS